MGVAVLVPEAIIARSEEIRCMVYALALNHFILREVRINVALSADYLYVFSSCSSCSSLWPV